MKNEKELKLWRETEFHLGLHLMHKKQVEEAIDLYSTYSDVLNSKEKRELKKLKKEKEKYIILGKSK